MAKHAIKIQRPANAGPLTGAAPAWQHGDSLLIMPISYTVGTLSAHKDIEVNTESKESSVFE